jgi:pimeloyl-ACP methyl ester carboxylesterase
MNYRIYGRTRQLASDNQDLVIQIELNTDRGHAGEGTLISDDNLVEIELDGGLKLMLFPDELASSPWFKLSLSRDSAEPVLALSTDATRGLLGSLVRSLIVYTVKTAGKLVARIRDFALAKIEQQLCPQPRLLQWHEQQWQSAQQVQSTLRPALILIHGTFSSTEGSFGGLWENASPGWSKLQNHFEQSIYALEHQTLAQTPLGNAIDLLNRCTNGQVLELLTHSRGGLVAELLAQELPSDSAHAEIIDQLERAIAGADDDEIALYRRLLVEYRTLIALKKQKQIRIKRITRVACPARGTTLLSPKRLRNWLSLFRHSLSLAQVAAPAQVQGIKAISEILEAVVLDCIKPHEIPGLAAMDPSGVLIRHLINHPELHSSSELAVIASDTRVEGSLKVAADLALDFYFGRSNDWVVDCDSMIGGAKRASTMQFRQSSSVMHTQYFRDPRFAPAIIDSLLIKDFDKLPGFKQAQIVQSELRGLKVRQGNPTGPVLFVLPGIMGSHLSIGQNRIWIDFPSYISGGFGKLRIDQEGVKATDLVASAYQDFVDEFSSTHEVIVFPYDWRQSMKDAGTALNTALAQQLKRIDLSKRAVQIVAHSMGGMVVRAMLNLPNNAWQLAKQNIDSRILMLGTPNSGSHAVTEIVTGKERTIRLLEKIDLTNPIAFHVGIATAFPGALDLLPIASDEDPRNYFNPQDWQAIGAKFGAGWPLPEAWNLQRAKGWRDAISTQNLAKERVIYIAGHAAATPSGVDLSGQHLAIKHSTRGDGRVLWDTGIPIGVEKWFAEGVKHGDLPKNKKVQRACRELLAGRPVDIKGIGTSEPPAIKPGLFSWLRGVDDASCNGIPDLQVFEQAALATGESLESPGSKEDTLSRLSVKICFGHLKNARYPLFVGHYQGDGLLSAEAALDQVFDRALSARHELDNYPGEIGTHLCVLGNQKRSLLAGAVVMGLGEIGSLTTANLSRTVCAAVLGYASRRYERARFDLSTEAFQDAQRTIDSAGLSFLLIGSGAAGMSVHEATRAILQGVHEARLALKDKVSDLLDLKEIEFVELFKDKAHTLWSSLQRQLIDSDPLSKFFRAPTTIQRKADGRTRLAIDEHANWWLPLKIQTLKGSLIVENLESKARSELNVVETDGLVQALVRQSISNPRRNIDTEFALFELLLPTEIKDLAPDTGELRLILTPAAAAYPWELIADRLQTRRGNSAVPQSVRVGMVRQLTTLRYRAHVRYTLENRALIIADPQTNAQLQALPGAQTEAKEVNDALQAQQWSTVLSEREAGGEIVCKLFCSGYRIIHFAGHGVDDVERYLDGFATPRAKSKDPLSGLVVGDGEFITSKSLEQLRELPTLVFVNCCHLGVMLDQPQRSAAQFAEKFIELGVRCVIAAGWAVDDAAASTFAACFYEHFLRGASFGESVRYARKQTFTEHRDSNTFAAYQCYGDPAFVLNRNAPKATQTDPLVLIPSSDYFIHEVLARASDVASIEALEDRIEKETTDRIKNGVVYAAIAKAYGRFKEFKRAAHAAKTAISLSGNNADAAGFDTFTLWINLQSRFIESDEAQSQVEKAKGIRDLVSKIKHLIAISPTAERYGLLGATLRRLVLVSTAGNAQLTALNDASAAYFEQQKRIAKPSYQHVYTNLRQHLCQIAIRGLTKLSKQAKAKADLIAKQELGALKIECDELPAPETFWERIANTHIAMFTAAVQGCISAQTIDMLVLGYRKGFEWANDAEAQSAVLEQVEFIHRFNDIAGLEELLTKLKNLK